MRCSISPVISRPLKPVCDVDALSAELRGTARAMLDNAICHARDPAADGQMRAVHEIRKRIKELRALLRLAGDCLVDATGRRVRKRANARLRTTARLLSESRDAEVMLQTLGSLTGGERESPTLAAIELRARLASCNEGGGTSGAVFEQVLLTLGEIRTAAAEWRLDFRHGDAWLVIGPNLKRIYRRARRSMQQARQESDAEAWHTWRRRMKDLRYALELLRGAAPEAIVPHIAQAKQITDALGEDHDLTVLMDFASAHTPSRTLEAAKSQRSDALRREALEAGAALLAKRPREFVERVGAHWQSAAQTW